MAALIIRGAWLWRAMFALLLAQLVYTGAVVLIGRPPAALASPSYEVLRAWPVGGTTGLGLVALSLAVVLLWARTRSTGTLIATVAATAAFWAVWTGCIVSSYFLNGFLPLPAYGQSLVTTVAWVLLSLSVPPEDRHEEA